MSFSDGKKIFFCAIFNQLVVAANHIPRKKDCRDQLVMFAMGRDRVH